MGKCLLLLRAVFPGQRADGVGQWSAGVINPAVLQHLQAFREGSVVWQERRDAEQSGFEDIETFGFVVFGGHAEPVEL